MPKMAVIYASGLGRTKKMAEAIANGAMTIERCFHLGRAVAQGLVK